VTLPYHHHPYVYLRCNDVCVCVTVCACRGGTRQGVAATCGGFGLSCRCSSCDGEATASVVLNQRGLLMTSSLHELHASKKGEKTQSVRALLPRRYSDSGATQERTRASVALIFTRFVCLFLNCVVSPRALRHHGEANSSVLRLVHFVPPFFFAVWHFG
jgi:hypothetical protein